jgi:hypothetical protein
MPSASSTYAGVRAPFSTALTPGVEATTHSALRERVSPRRSGGSRGSSLLATSSTRARDRAAARLRTAPSAARSSGR